jgi:hypothetical protein
VSELLSPPRPRGRRGDFVCRDKKPEGAVALNMFILCWKVNYFFVVVEKIQQGCIIFLCVVVGLVAVP